MKQENLIYAQQSHQGVLDPPWPNIDKHPISEHERISVLIRLREMHPSQETLEQELLEQAFISSGIDERFDKERLKHIMKAWLAAETSMGGENLPPALRPRCITEWLRYHLALASLYVYLRYPSAQNAWYAQKHIRRVGSDRQKAIAGNGRRRNARPAIPTEPVARVPLSSLVALLNDFIQEIYTDDHRPALRLARFMGKVIEAEIEWLHRQ